MIKISYWEESCNIWRGISRGGCYGFFAVFRVVCVTFPWMIRAAAQMAQKNLTENCPKNIDAQPKPCYSKWAMEVSLFFMPKIKRI